MATDSGLWLGYNNESAQQTLSSSTSVLTQSFNYGFAVDGVRLRVKTTAAASFWLYVNQSNSGYGGNYSAVSSWTAVRFDIPGAYNGFVTRLFPTTPTTPNQRYVVGMSHISGSSVQWQRSTSKDKADWEAYQSNIQQNVNFSMGLRRHEPNGFVWDGTDEYYEDSAYSVDTTPLGIAFTRDYAVDAVSVDTATYTQTTSDVVLELHKFNGSTLTELVESKRLDNIPDNYRLDWVLSQPLQANVQYMLQVKNPNGATGQLALWGGRGKWDASYSSYNGFTAVSTYTYTFRTRKYVASGPATKRWNGAAWVSGAIKRFDGAAWVNPASIVRS